MDGNPPVNPPAAQPAKAAAPTPIRDIAAPPSPDKQSDMSVHEPTNQPGAPEADKTKPTTVVHSEQHKEAAAADEYAAGNGLAICAAVVIVLVIAGLITYAYLRTQNIALF